MQDENARIVSRIPDMGFVAEDEALHPASSDPFWQ